MIKKQKKLSTLPESKTPAKSGETQATRNDKGQFLPGISGNPAGPEPGYKQERRISYFINKILDEMPEGSDKDYAELIARRAVLNAIAGDHSARVYVTERHEGKVPEDFRGDITHGGVIGNIEISGKESKELVTEWVKFVRDQIKKRNAPPTTDTPK